MPSKTTKKALAIFFLVFGIGLSVFILTQGIDLFRGSKGYVTDTATPSVDCIKFFYEIDKISYESGELAFTIKNLDYSEDFSNITVKGESSQTLPLIVPKGTSQQISVGADLTTNFSFYPAGCQVYKTTCMLTGECSSE
ncbi:hypothetical protein CMO88_03695 [Candidatus Woesearchaeota archaeon]|nr:hypothetical protein [Candidatus Woesearchaeota archaeon]|tara:strand:+ start:5027 stop:5443 length:417 start_codon:yes stop_codon:yes gene_type:complete